MPPLVKLSCSRHPSKHYSVHCIYQRVKSQLPPNSQLKAPRFEVRAYYVLWI